LHPALFSSFYDLQAEVGSQLIAFFHKRPVPSCGCSGSGRAWAEPYGNWLDLQNKGIELGFNAYSKGIAAGVDWEVIDHLTIGVGGAWNHSDLHWHNERGHADVDSFFGGGYFDFAGDSMYIGGSLLAGRDFFNTFRKIVFTNVNEDAQGDYKGLDILSQLSTAYFLGPEKCCLLPYFNLDFFYLNQDSFQEKNAPGLNLSVESNSGATMRSELGLGLQVIDRNREETLCVSPQVAMGWTSICPLFRHKYKSTFEGYTIPFRVVGWDHTWQLLTLRFGLSISYTCFSFSGEYIYELAPQSGTPLSDQKANLRLDISW
jgi:outer membrane autotransporter protein